MDTYALFTACYVDSVSGVMAVGNRINDLELRWEDGDTVLHVCVTANSYNVLEHLLNVEKVRVNLRNRLNETALHVAVRLGHLKAVNILCKYGADVNARTDAELTPLHYAATYERHEAVPILLAYGADPTLTVTIGSKEATPRDLGDAMYYAKYEDAYLPIANRMRRDFSADLTSALNSAIFQAVENGHFTPLVVKSH